MQADRRDRANFFCFLLGDILCICKIKAKIIAPHLEVLSRETFYFGIY
jgi:hypothetical protein